MSQRIWGRAGASALLLLAATASQPLDLQARTWRVWKDGSGDFTAIQPAVDAAAPGDTVLIGPGRYTESSDFQFDVTTSGETFVGVEKDDLTLMGVYRDSVVVGPLEQNFQGFLPKGIAMRSGQATRLTIRDLTVRNVREGLRLRAESRASNVKVDSCDVGIVGFQTTAYVDSTLIEGCTELAVGIAGPGRFELTASTIRSNLGGATFLDDASVEIRDCSFPENTSGLKLQRGTMALVEDCTFLDNVAAAISVTSASTVTVLDTRMRGGRNGVTLELESTFDGSGLVLGPFAEEIVVALGGARIDVRDSDLRLGFQPAIRLGGYPTSGPTVLHDFRHNYWTTTDSQAIADAIHDGNDDPNINSFVLFDPFRLQSTPTEQQSIGGLKAGYRSPNED